MGDEECCWLNFRVNVRRELSGVTYSSTMLEIVLLNTTLWNLYPKKVYQRVFPMVMNKPAR